MPRTNLSTRPFYNERVIQVLLGAAALVVLVLTAYNALRVVTLTRQNRELSVLVGRDRGEAQRLTAEARRIRAGIDQAALKVTAEAADSANRLIDQRTFSWTALFNHIEETLPADVMLTAVQPSVVRDRSIVQMTVLARRPEDLDEFMERLEGTGAFADVLLTQEDLTEDDLHKGLLRVEYLGAAAGAPGAAEAPGAGAGETPAGADAGAPGEAAATAARGGGR